LNGNASKEGITRDFEEMKKQGISGALLFDADSGDHGAPYGPDYMGSEWRELFKFAVSEADRLGITLTANMTRGWNAGGTWVTPEHGIKNVTCSASQFKGPGKTNIVLPRRLGRMRTYRDIAVLACPIPAGFSGQIELWQSDQIVDVTQFMDAKGRLVWDAPDGNWSILRIGFQANGKRVSRNFKASAGLEIDPMSAEAMDLHFANTGAKMIEDAGPLAGKTFQYLHIDSWEIKQPNWTAKMPTEFLKRRGYDLTTWLPALCGRQIDNATVTEAFLQDFRVTVCDLIAENYYGRLDTWSVAGRRKTDVGTKFGHNRAWWPMADGWLNYLARSQYMLRQGKFVADFAYLQDERIPPYVVSRPGETPRCPPGYDYDALHTEVLQARATAKGGRLQLESGMSYRYLVLPPEPDAILTPATSKKLKELAEAGVQVIGPGYREGTLEDILSADGLVPAIEFRNASPNARFEKIHRRDGEIEIFFISNQAVKEIHADVTFRVSGKQPELWNPVTGKTRELPEWSEESGRTVVPMTFAAKESSFVVFRKQAKAKKTRGAENFPELTALKPLSGPWQVSFDPKWGGPESIVFDELVDWTQRPEEGIRYYSGIATYRKVFSLQSSVCSNQNARGASPQILNTEHRSLNTVPLFLDLGALSCIARVRLNGKDLGVVWTAPWRIEITDTVRPEGNQLEIEVANHWLNRIIGDEKLVPEERFTQTNVGSKNSKLQPAGLLGPVGLFIEKD
jgi:hypothetical protein